MGMGEKELKDIIDKHGKWLRNESGGERANLRYADLRSANLSSADLNSADLSSANLGSADLNYANLGSANLGSANLNYANLRSANLNYANLRSANLNYANLRYADLRSANLSSADLRYADLSSANLGSANLRYADLSSANLGSANLNSANLRSIKEDFLKRLSLVKNEVVGLYDFLMRGKVDGTAYEGECACFVGSIANIRKEYYLNLSCDLKPDSDSPTEKWFLAILKGDTPENNQVARITKGWLEEFMTKESLVIPKYRLFSNLEKPELFID
jgi:hypothetical protein